MSKSIPVKLPVWKHPSGRWCRKVRQRFFYFGKIEDDPEGVEAMGEWNRVGPDLLAGRAPRPKMDGMTVATLGGLFLDAKVDAVKSNELQNYTLNDYRRTCAEVVKFFGPGRVVEDLDSRDFAGLRAFLAKGIRLTTLAKKVQVIRSLFNFAYDEGYVNRTVRFGKAFSKPKQKAIRVERAEQPKRLFSAAEVRALLEASAQPLTAYIWLGVNCGFGQSDLATLTKAAIDLEGGWIEHPRGKTGAPRKCKLWSKTMAAVTEVMEARPKAAKHEYDCLAFLDDTGRPLMRYSQDPDGKGRWVNPIGKRFGLLMKRLDMSQKGRAFYSLRHSMRTAADSHLDRAAVDYIMGHLPMQNDMRSHYVHGIDDSRLEAVSAHVHCWLFPEKT